MRRRKYEYEDERRDIPEIWKLLIAVVVVGMLIFLTNKFCDYIDKVDIESQYPNELVIEERI